MDSTCKAYLEDLDHLILEFELGRSKKDFYMQQVWWVTSKNLANEIIDKIKKTFYERFFVSNVLSNVYSTPGRYWFSMVPPSRPNVR